MKKTDGKAVLCFICLLLFSLVVHGEAPAATITVDADNVIGTVNPMIYGNNMNVGSGNSTDESTGWGAWDPALGKSVPNVVKFAQDAGITILRFPGGNLAKEYSWWDCVGPTRESSVYGDWDESDNAYGTDEHMAFAKDVGANVMITVNTVTGTPEEAAAWVAYMNGSDTDPSTTIIWNGMTVKDFALEREANRKDGLTGPYNVKYWEIDNEIWDDYDVSEYIDVFQDFYQAMTDVDPNIKVGAVTSWRYAWFKTLIEGIGGEVDFLIIHAYKPFVGSDPTTGPVNVKAIKDAGVNETFKATLAAPAQIQGFYTSVRNNLEITPASADRAQDIELLITEYNTGFYTNLDSDPANPTVKNYQYSLGTALQNAEALNYLMVADNKIGAANTWEFKSHVFGQVDGLADPYIERPNQYTYEMYAKYFGTELVNTIVTSDTYDSILVPGIAAVTNYTTDADDVKLRIWLQRSPGTNISGDVWYDDIVVRESNSDLNLLTNPGFEDSPDFTGWVHLANPKGVASYIDSTTSRSDSNSFKLSFTTGNDPEYFGTTYGMYQDVTVTQNTRYTIEGYIKTQGITPEPVNLLTNPGFESGSTGWTQDPLPAGVASAGVDTGEFRSGSNSYMVDFNNTVDVDYMHTLQTVDIDPDLTYVVEGYVKTSGITSGSGVTLELEDNLGKVSPKKYSPKVKGTTNGWTYIAANRLKPSSGAAQITVKLRRYSGDGTIDGTAWWDDIRLQPLPQTYAPNIQIQAINPDDSDDSFDEPTTIAGLLGTHDWLKMKTAGTAYLSANASKSADGSKLYLMVLNKHLTDAIKPDITISGAFFTNQSGDAFTDFLTVTAYELNGDSVDATNEVVANTVKIDGPIPLTPVSPSFTYNFPAHSLTAIEIICINDPARIGATYYPSLQVAYDNASETDNNTIQVQEIISIEDLNFTADKSVTIEGGYNCDYSAVVGETTIQGDMDIANSTNESTVSIKSGDISVVAQ